MIDRAATDIWDRAQARTRGVASRHPVAARRIRQAVVIWTWLSIPLVLAALVFVPSLREALRVAAWCYVMLAMWFLAARTKTLSWRAVALTLSAACVWAWAILVIKVGIAKLMGTDTSNQDAAVLIAGPTEEILKLAPALLLFVVARRRSTRLAVVDFLLLGLAAGIGFQLVEDAVRRLVLVTPSGGIFGALADLLAPDPNDPSGGLPQYGFSLFGGWSRNDDGFYWMGHHIATAAVMLAAGTAVRLRHRVRRVIWFVPLLVLATVIFDHRMANYMASDRLGIRSSLIDLHEVTLPGWLVDSWMVTLEGRLVAWLVGIGFVTALVLDARRIRRSETQLPAVPAIAVCERARQRLAVLEANGSRTTARRDADVRSAKDRLRHIERAVQERSVVGRQAGYAGGLCLASRRRWQ